MKTEEEQGNIDINQIIRYGPEDTSKLIDIGEKIFEESCEELTQPAGKIFHFFDNEAHPESEIYVINKPPESRYYGGYIDPSMYNRIQLIKTCFKDHRPDIYEDSLHGLSKLLMK